MCCGEQLKLRYLVIILYEVEEESSNQEASRAWGDIIIEMVNHCMITYFFL